MITLPGANTRFLSYLTAVALESSRRSTQRRWAKVLANKPLGGPPLVSNWQRGTKMTKNPYFWLKDERGTNPCLNGIKWKKS